MSYFNKKYIIISTVICALLTMTSCEKEIDVDLRVAEPRIVIEGVVELDSLATVRVTKSKGFNTDNTFLPVEGAIVTVSDDLGNKEQLVLNDEGWYIASALKGTEGRTYSLSVKYEGVDYTSVSTMPRFVPILEIEMYYIPAMKYATPMIKFQDPKGEVNYYNSRIFVNGRRVTLNDAITTDELRDGLIIERILPIFEQDNDHKKVEKGDEIRVELITLDKGAYTFFENLSRIEDSETNPASNIKGGALGYFSACTRDSKIVIADW